MIDPLTARFEALLAPGPSPDWLDVRRRARRSRRPLLLVAAALVLFVAAPAIAVAVRSGVLFWGDAAPAPPTVVKRFSALERAVDEGAFARVQSQIPLDLGILAGQARVVPLADGTVAYVAPERAGGFCALFENPADPGAYASDCGAGHSPGPVSSGSHSNRYGSYVHGHVVGDASDSVQIVLDDGSTVDVPVTWIGRPIDAGLFFMRLDPGRYVEALVLRDAQGRELARDGHLGAAHRQIEKLKKQLGNGGATTAPGGDSPQPGGFVLPSG